MKLQRLYSLTRQALDHYHMIDDGDSIAIGLSGGKDSSALLYALAGMQSFYPKKYTLHAITVDLGYSDFDTEPIRKLCEHFSIPLKIIHTQIGKIIFDRRCESNPCSLCATMRKGALNNAALSLNCNKVAYAHHRDDFTETLLMSLFYEGRIGTFSPIMHLDRTDITVIRPLIYVRESDIIGFKNRYDLEIVTNPCPSDGFTKREYVKKLTRQLIKDNPGIDDRLFHAACDIVERN